MFSFLKPKIHEPEDVQLAEVSETPLGVICASGLSCDLLPNAQGPFGTNYNNPIPVNGLVGTFKYLNKLHAPTGPVYYHRLGSLDADVSDNPIDAYELVTWNGDFWDVLFFDVYHPRRSNKAPEKYSLRSYKSNPLGDIPFGFGADLFCPNFPYDLPLAVERVMGMAALGRRVRERVEKTEYTRPIAQKNKIMTVRSRLTSMQSL